MSTALVLLALAAVLLLAVGLAVKVMYPDGDALDEDNRRVAAWWAHYRNVPEVAELAQQRKHLWEARAELLHKYPDPNGGTE